MEGPYKTKQRELIWTYLREHSGSHTGAEDIAAHLREQGKPVGKSTIYRYLDRLVAEGVVRKFYLEEGMSACYQFIGEDGACREHFHLKCLRCGRLFHVQCDFLNEVQSHIRQNHSFIIDHTKTVLYGVCGDCRDSQTPAPGKMEAEHE